MPNGRGWGFCDLIHAQENPGIYQSVPTGVRTDTRLKLRLTGGTVLCLHASKTTKGRRCGSTPAMSAEHWGYPTASTAVALSLSGNFNACLHGKFSLPPLQALEYRHPQNPVVFNEFLASSILSDTLHHPKKVEIIISPQLITHLIPHTPITNLTHFRVIYGGTHAAHAFEI